MTATKVTSRSTLALAAVAASALQVMASAAGAQEAPRGAVRDPAHSTSDPGPSDLETIGVAWMEEDGTVVMRLRARTPDGGLAEGLLRYPRTDRRYREILNHVGLTRPGQSRAVAPWPE